MVLLLLLHLCDCTIAVPQDRHIGGGRGVTGAVLLPDCYVIMFITALGAGVAWRGAGVGVAARAGLPLRSVNPGIDNVLLLSYCKVSVL